MKKDGQTEIAMKITRIHREQNKILVLVEELIIKATGVYLGGISRLSLLLLWLLRIDCSRVRSRGFCSR